MKPPVYDEGTVSLRLKQLSAYGLDTLLKQGSK
jgi:hypothetical protein